MAKLKEALFQAIQDKRVAREISCLDPIEGTKFRGKTIPEIFAALPRYPGREYPSLESFYWFLLTGEVPTEQEAAHVIEDFRRRQALPQYAVIVLRALPRDTHPMTMFSAAIFAMQQESVFLKRYNEGMNEEGYWDPMYEDCTSLLAKLPSIAAYIYRMKYKEDMHIPPNIALDFCGNFAWQMGMPERYDDVARMYFILHSDHESGNGSNHISSSFLSDAYYTLCADLSSMAGPLHKLPNQEVLRWLMDVRTKMGGKLPTEMEMQAFVWDTLESGRPVPGYGHDVLRNTDPRYTAQRDFCLKNLPDDPLFQYVDMLYTVVPSVLEKQGKPKNLWPNADAQSGVVQWHYGVTEWDFYPVLAGIGRAVGVLARMICNCGIRSSAQQPHPFGADRLEKLA